MMKLLKIITLLFVFIAHVGYADPKLANAKENKIAQIVRTSEPAEQAVSILVKNRETVVDANGQALAQFSYEIINNNKQPIASVQWISVYTHNREVIYSQDMQLELENLLQPNQVLPINLQIPFAKIDEKFRAVFLNTQEKIDVYKIARVIEFSDKSQIIEKE